MITDDGSLKFSWKELFSNGDGLTSGSSFVGVVTSLVCLVLFCMILLFYFWHTAESSIVLSIIDKITVLFGISNALLGVNKITSKFGNNMISACGDSGSSRRRGGRSKQAPDAQPGGVQDC